MIRDRLYPDRAAWRGASARRLCLFGMSGLGKTHVSSILRATGDWFHYSVDYRIGTRYMGEHIADGFKAEAMKVPALARLLKTDSIWIASNITFDNLAPLSDYLGKPGDPAKGGLPFEEYLRRQAIHADAERAAMLDTGRFIDRARALYGYESFVCDTSGSLCEVVDPADPDDPVLSRIAADMLLVWIEGTEAHTEELIRRFDRAPKPMYYPRAFIEQAWTDWLDRTGDAPDAVDPDAFVRWTYARALTARQPKYAAIADGWGIRVPAADLAGVRTAEDVVDVIGAHLPGD